MKRFLGISLSLILLLSGFFFWGGNSTGNAYVDSDTRYSVPGGVAFFDYTDYIYYDYCVIDEYYNPRSLPSFIADGAGVCAVSAGSNALAYYDWDYEQLIPNHTKFTFMGYEFYGSQGAGAAAMISNLCNRMATTSSGTTVAGYLSGMNSYVEDKGLTISQTSAMSNGSLNMAVYKSAILSGKLMSVFFSGFAVTPYGCLTFHSGYDKIIQSVFTGNHVMMAYGYLNIKYYNSNHQLVNELRLLAVSTGLTSPFLGYVNTAQYGNVNDAYITHIY